MLGFAFCKCLFFYNKWPINHFPKHEHMWWKLINLQHKKYWSCMIVFFGSGIIQEEQKICCKVCFNIYFLGHFWQMHIVHDILSCRVTCKLVMLYQLKFIEAIMFQKTTLYNWIYVSNGMLDLDCYFL